MRLGRAWRVGLLVSLVAWSATTAAEQGAHLATRPPGAAVASGHALATEAGMEILREGGNAFDAAVAVSSTLSVVEPISSGLGGGGFFLLHDARSGKDVFLDARETSPESATPQAFLDTHGALDPNRSENGPWSAGIPGLPAALVELAGKYGRLPLKTSLAPAIRVAREGFPVYARLERGYASRRAVMERYPGTRAVYLASLNGVELPGDGKTIDDPELLMEAMEAREELHEASSIEAIDSLAAKARDDIRQSLGGLASLFLANDKAAIRKALLRLRYLDKFADEAKARRSNLGKS